MEQNNSILGVIWNFGLFRVKLQYDVLIEIKPNMSILHWYKGKILLQLRLLQLRFVNRKCNKNRKCNNLFFFFSKILDKK